MLKNLPAFSSFSVDDIEAAKKFYGDTLGLEVTEGEYGILELHTKGNQPIMVYPKDDHEPATFTVLNFTVEDIESKVDELTEKGIEFEQYEGDIKTNEKGISEMRSEAESTSGGGDGLKMAWFKDPAGNVLALLQEK